MPLLPSLTRAYPSRERCFRQPPRWWLGERRHSCGKDGPMSAPLGTTRSMFPAVEGHEEPQSEPRRVKRSNDQDPRGEGGREDPPRGSRTWYRLRSPRRIWHGLGEPTDSYAERRGRLQRGNQCRFREPPVATD